MQHDALGLELIRKLGRDPGQREIGLLQIAALIPDAREEVPNAVAKLGIDGVREHLVENLTCYAVLAIGQIQRAEQEVCVARVRG